MRLYIGSAIFMCVAVFCGRKGVEEWRRFRRGRGQPLLAGVTAAQLAAIPIDWPLPETRWPAPLQDPSRPMEPVIAAAYSRLAGRAKRVSGVAAQVLLVVGGGWLGVTLPGIWGDYRESATEATQNLRAHSGDFLTHVTWAQFAHFVPVVLIALGATLLVLARAYEQAEDIYNNAAVPQAPQLTQTTAEGEPARSGRLNALSRLLRSV